VGLLDRSTEGFGLAHQLLKLRLRLFFGRFSGTVVEA
jgi:hypothetical protein